MTPDRRPMSRLLDNLLIFGRVLRRAGVRRPRRAPARRRRGARPRRPRRARRRLSHVPRAARPSPRQIAIFDVARSTPSGASTTTDAALARPAGEPRACEIGSRADELARSTDRSLGQTAADDAGRRRAGDRDGLKTWSDAGGLGRQGLRRVHGRRTRRGARRAVAAGLAARRAPDAALGSADAARESISGARSPTACAPAATW